jgi:hypothetical protein
MNKFIFWENDGFITNTISIDRYNNCPHCNVVNQPKILGYIDNLITEKKEYTYDHGIGIPAPVLIENIDNFDKHKNNVFEKDDLVGYKTDMLYQCTNAKCMRVFLIHYESENDFRGDKINTRIKGVSPLPNFEIISKEDIKQVSGRYYQIYSQAMKAELAGLNEICGMGYRKALEFLIKDYVTYLNKDNPTFNKEKLLGKLLGKVISEDIESRRIQEITKRAVWLGNDEVHYLRKWEDKDINDLKNIIDVAVHEIEMELAYRKTLEQMPSGK